GQRPAAPGTHPAPARLSARPSRCKIRRRGRRSRDRGGRRGARGPRSVRSHPRSGGPSTHQAQGMQLRLELRARRIHRHLRRRGPTGARPVAQGGRRIPRFAGEYRLPPGQAQFFQRARKRPDQIVRAGLCIVVRRAASGARPARRTDAAGRHVQPFPHGGAAQARRLGPVQCDRGRRSRHPHRAAGHAGRHARLHDLRGSAGAARRLAAPAIALDEGLYADLAGAYAPALCPGPAHRGARLPGFSSLHRRLRRGRACNDAVVADFSSVGGHLAGGADGDVALDAGDRQPSSDRARDRQPDAARLAKPRSLWPRRAALLGDDLGRGLARAWSTRHAAVPLGKDAAWSEPAMMRAFAFAVAVALSIATAHAAAWTLPRGHWQVFTATTQSSAELSFDSKGHADLPASFNKLLIQNCIEYGLTGYLTLFATPSFVLARVQPAAGAATRVNNSSFEGGARLLLYGGHGDLSLQGSYKTAGAFDLSVSANRASGRQIELRLLYGTSFKLLGRNGFFDIQA